MVLRLGDDDGGGDLLLGDAVEEAAPFEDGACVSDEADEIAAAEDSELNWAGLVMTEVAAYAVVDMAPPASVTML